jgi:hypothetical protein
VRELRKAGLSESTIAIIVGVANRIYRYAARRLGWSGANPVSLLLPSERPKPSRTARRRIYEGRELEQTISAAPEPYRTLFTLAALTAHGSRSCSVSLGPMCGSATWTTPRSSSVGSSTVRAIVGRLRPMAQRGPFRCQSS